MKNIKLLLFTFFISTGFTFGQLENKVTYTEYDATKVVINDGEEHVAEAFKVTEELTPIILNPEDQYKLNQNFISLPTQVTKKVRLDFAPPYIDDQSVTFKYLKPRNIDLIFNLTKEGILIKTDDCSTSVINIKDKNEVLYTVVEKKIQKEGNFSIILSNGNKIQLKVSNYIK